MIFTIYVPKEIEIPDSEISALTAAAMEFWEIADADEVTDDIIVGEAAKADLIDSLPEGWRI